MSQQKPIVTRFAPSPTGALHVGGARTALFNWAYARHHGGKFILRIEDTDLARSTEAATEGIIRDLKWFFGCDAEQTPWDEGPTDATHDQGEAGPYFQSQRLAQGIYEPYFQKLIDADLAYEDEGALRFRMAAEDITIDDQILGPVTVPASDHKDFVIRKGDGYPTFHFAVTIDDATMGVTHVIRGQEHLMNSAKHIALQRALDLPTPTYAHIPLIFNADGSKMSKRDKAKAARAAAMEHLKTNDREAFIQEIVEKNETLNRLVTPASTNFTPAQVASFLDKENDEITIAKTIAFHLKCGLPEIEVEDFRTAGYLPDVLVNYLTLLGWNPGDDLEKFDQEFLARHFSFERCGKSAARFDRDKLASFNADAIRELNDDDWIAAVMEQAGVINPYTERNRLVWQKFRDERPDDFRLFALSYKDRSKTVEDPFTMGAFFLPDYQVQYDPKAVEKVLKKGDPSGIQVLNDLLPILKLVGEWGKDELESCVRGFAEDAELGMGKIAQPLRVAVTGTTVSPGIFETLTILGHETTIARIEQCIAVHS